VYVNYFTEVIYLFVIEMRTAVSYTHLRAHETKANLYVRFCL